MKGYHTDSGFMGYLDGRYVLFASDTDYYDYLEENLKSKFSKKSNYSVCLSLFCYN